MSDGRFSKFLGVVFLRSCPAFFGGFGTYSYLGGLKTERNSGSKGVSGHPLWVLGGSSQ